MHKVMWKQASDAEENFVEFDVSRTQGFRQTWQGLGIVHTSRKHVDETLFNRIKKVFLEQKGAGTNNPNPSLTDAFFPSTIYIWVITRLDQILYCP